MAMPLRYPEPRRSTGAAPAPMAVGVGPGSPLAAAGGPGACARTAAVREAPANGPEVSGR
ncbi:hypothetical protein SRO_7362 [Streptomyces rochei]|nr:hypothetical protein SRO_7362 [Streptomyces rochei]